MLETGLRIGEALHLEWADVTLAPVNGARFGFLRVREGKSKNARRIIPLTDRAAAMLREREASKASGFVFANRDGKPYLGTRINHLHRDACAPKVDGKRQAIFPADFVTPLSTPYNAYKAWGIGSGRFHHHADCWSQQHRGFAAVHPSNPGGSGAGF